MPRRLQTTINNQYENQLETWKNGRTDYYRVLCDGSRLYHCSEGCELWQTGNRWRGSDLICSL